MELQWTIYLKRSGNAEAVQLATFDRPAIGATPADFGLSISEARQLLAALQQAVAQDQICAYDARRRCCRHCGRYRRIEDWRLRTFATGLGEIHVRVPRVISCLCTPEPLDDNDDPADLRFSECPIESLLPGRRTPEVAYLCGKQGASIPYRCAARTVADLTGLARLSHMTVRKETITCGEYIEDQQFHEGWFAGGSKRDGVRHLRVAIDGTVLTATPFEEVSKFEVVAGRVEREGQMGRRFVCALPRRPLTQMLVAAALEQCGWTKETVVDVITDGARGMRSLVTSVAPRVAPKILDWFHLSMKLQAVKTPLFARTYFMVDRPMLITRCERLWSALRTALWRGRADFAIELTRTLVASLKEGDRLLPPFYVSCAATACGAAATLLTFLTRNRRDLIDYQRARMAGRRVSSASAESVMNHLVNRRLSRRQQMRWSMKGAHCLLQTRVELLDGRLEQSFARRFDHFRSPELHPQ